MEKNICNFIFQKMNYIQKKFRNSVRVFTPKKAGTASIPHGIF